MSEPRKPRTLVAFYYLAYPDFSPTDASIACSITRVEVGNESSTVDNFEDTYELTVCTTGFVRAAVERDGYFAIANALIVDRFEDGTIRRALEALMPRLDEVATTLE